MVTIYQIIELIAPQSTHIAYADVNIVEPIQLTPQNERDDVLMWASSKNTSLISEVKRGTIICPPINEAFLQPHCNYIFVDNPRGAFSKVLKFFFDIKQKNTIAPTAVIDPSVSIGENVFIGNNVVIEKNSCIGNNSVIGHNTVLHSGTIVKNNVKIGCNNVIGGIGFGYEKDENGVYVVMPHIGNVVLEDNVEIGNCNTIDRAVIGSTILRKNVKVDNLVHIAHGVDIGENSLIIANSMIGGSTKIGKNVWIAPSSSLINKIEIGDDVVVGIGAVVLKTAESGEVIVGNPARSLKKNT